MPIRTILSVAAALLVVSSARADDWPQWMGPKRDNTWREDGVLDRFPKGGPKVVWRAPVAGGFAGPAVSGGKVFVTDYVTADDVKVDNFDRKEFSGTERVLCLDQKTGKEKWKHEYPVKYTVSYPAGPRCTPTVHEGKVYVLGTEGDLFCFDAESGKIAWEKNLNKEYKTKTPLWGYAAHPLIDGKKLVTITGGAGSHVIALDKDTGKELWKAGTQAEPGYSPVFITEAAGKRQMIVTGTKAVYSLDPDSGKQYWTTPFGVDNGCTIMTPVRSGDHLYFGGYRQKNMLLKLTAEKPGVEVVWKNKKNHGMSPINVQPMMVDGVLCGYDEDGQMFGVELQSGKRVWESNGPVGKEPAGSATAFMVKNGDRYFFFAETGDLVIGKLSAKGYDETDRAKVIEPTYAAYGRKVVWCPPAYADKKMCVRNDKEIICVDLAK